MAEPFFLNRFQTPYFPARPVCAYSIVQQPRYFFCQMNPVQPDPTTNKRRRKNVKGKRSFAAPPRPRNPLKKLGDETHGVGAPRVVACVTKKDLPTGTTYAPSYRQMKKGSVRGCGGGVIPRCDLLTVLRNHCRDENLRACREGVSTKSEFDFVYLPMDFKQFWNHKRTANLGYAFVNFTSFTGANRFYKKFHNEQWKGLEALKKNFESKVFWCHTEEYLPAVVEPPSEGVMQQPKVTPVGTRVGLPFVDYREVK
ncbi:terminal ear1-like protein [Pyrus ussuriensis x Pyrus communis]|uniref:Terminal ear1-like protein n=1 Tax=Pyrus ussuriensis x Pyrus communis TaxID=2448454 RepID=A0A5N5HN79_9ROSA|nr:terminal ear1-like protein [Pyrus ussuriensis x Pyrus communis]